MSGLHNVIVMPSIHPHHYWKQTRAQQQPTLSGRSTGLGTHILIQTGKNPLYFATFRNPKNQATSLSNALFIVYASFANSLNADLGIFFAIQIYRTGHIVCILLFSKYYVTMSHSPLFLCFLIKCCSQFLKPNE